jgi:hypothetical protein
MRENVDEIFSGIVGHKEGDNVTKQTKLKKDKDKERM